MRKLPVGVQNYSKLIDNNCVYVDKTFYILKLVQSGASSFIQSLFNLVTVRHSQIPSSLVSYRHSHFPVRIDGATPGFFSSIGGFYYC